jgi:hypothetical protein
MALAEALRKFLDLAAFGGAVAGPRMNRTQPRVGTLWRGCLPCEF